jgi:hypothetical protein
MANKRFIRMRGVLPMVSRMFAAFFSVLSVCCTRCATAGSELVEPVLSSSRMKHDEVRRVLT